MSTRKESSNGGRNRAGTPPKKTTIMRIIGRTMLGIIIFLGLAMVISWLLIIPKTPLYNIDSCNVTAHALTDRTLNASITFAIVTFNPNRRAAINIDSMKMTVGYSGQRFSSTVSSFTLPPGNKTLLNPVVRVFSISPFGDLNNTLRTNGFDLDLRFQAKISYSIDKWTSKCRTLEIYCGMVGRLKINATTSLDSKECNVDL